MLREYTDLIDRLGKPRWWDDQGVPRYCEFDPVCCGVYDHRVVLLEIECQACREKFSVARAWSSMDIEQRVHEHENGFPDPGSSLLADTVHYGDPPRHGGMGCVAGDTMNSIPRFIIEFWERKGGDDWVRRPEYEGELKCDWADSGLL